MASTTSTPPSPSWSDTLTLLSDTDQDSDFVYLGPDFTAYYAQLSQDIVVQLQELAVGCQSLAFTLTCTIFNHPEVIANTYPQVIVALATLQSSVQDLSRAYINHANTVLAPGRGGALDANLTNILTDSGLLSGQQAATMVAGAAEPEAEGKKKRKRTPHDPNAPKRALTPYFLYMQSARSQIAKELGDQAKPKEVADEGTRRWTEMPQNEKAVSSNKIHVSFVPHANSIQIWDGQYQKNLAAYRVKMAAYKSGQPVPDDTEAARLVEAGKAPEIVGAVEPDTEEEETPEPVKEPTPPTKKRRKTQDATPAKVETPKSPEKKSKKSKAAEPAPVAAPASSSKSTDKKKKSKKAA